MFIVSKAEAASITTEPQACLSTHAHDYYDDCTTAITDKWVSYATDVMHLSQKLSSPISFPSFTSLLSYYRIIHGLSGGLQ